MTVKLSFSDLIDLQSRLVLLPRIEEEGLGAIIASYTPRSRATSVEESRFLEEKKINEEENDQSAPTLETNSLESISLHREQDETITSAEHDEELMELTTGVANEELIHDQAKCDDEISTKSPEESKLAIICDEIKPQDVIGKALVGIEGSEVEKNWLDMEFSEILASTREVQAPIVLHFDSAPNNENGEDEDKNEKPTQRDEVRAITSSWSSWGISVAATAASNAKVYASATAVAVAKAAEEARLARVAKPTIVDLPAVPSRKYGLFLQATNGKFVELTGAVQKLPKVTTTSVLAIRENSTCPCPSQGFRYQWYRSFSTPNRSGIMSVSSSESTTSRDCVSISDDQHWLPLDGATFAVYQPCGNDIGHRLRCVVYSEVDREEALHVDDEPSLSEETLICETLAPIAADMNMFNGARQALVRGTYFGNLAGRGPADGREFGINISIGLADDKSISSAVTIHQISGGTAEPIHEEVIKQVSALADPSNPKNVDLIFPFGLPEGSSMVSALSQSGSFQLIAPNRITREMLLLALGIANFSGNPADLTEVTDLFPAFPDAQQCSETPLKVEIPRNDELFFTPEQEQYQVTKDSGQDEINSRVNMLELDLESMRSKLSQKDKTISDLRKQLGKSNNALQKAEKDVSSYRSDIQRALEDSKDCRNKLRVAEKLAEANDAFISRLKSEQSQKVSSLEQRVLAQSEKIIGLEKSVRTFQNEKAVLSAAVEARDYKLEKMNHLQASLDSLSAKVAKGDSLRSELSEMSKRYEVLCQDLEKVATSETECKEQLQNTLSTMNELCENLEAEKKRHKKCQSELENAQRMNQILKSERNSYKQKAESLTKEMSRLCKGGLTLQSIEKIITDEESRKTEISVLKAQKKKALEDLDQYRSAYEQQLVAQLSIGVNGAAIKALEQKAELERLISELTEYVNAKEMQLQTMRQINEALTDEIKQLAKANMDKNDI